MGKTNEGRTTSFFAAANGYTGFRSYFKHIFDPRAFSRLFILKGGPGTGKNTLMKNVYEAFKDNARSCELIYCSSDVRSLDGVIIETDRGRIGIVDGTAPHTTDPIYPGCTDEIINLGEFWDSNFLYKNRETIERINQEKSDAYKRAYNFLMLAGKCADKVDEAVENAYKDDELICRSSKSQYRCKLIDSFGKDGLLEILGLGDFAKKRVAITGIFGSDQTYLKRVAAMYSTDDHIIFPSVFSDSKIKAVYITSEDTIYVSNPSSLENFDNIIDVSDLLDAKKIKANSVYLEKLSAARESLLWHSQDEFKKASEYHFMLEDIYKSSMNFSLLNSVNEKLNERVADIIL